MQWIGSGGSIEHDLGMIMVIFSPEFVLYPWSYVGIGIMKVLEYVEENDCPFLRLLRQASLALSI